MEDSIKKILVFRLSSIGDIILTSPLLRCLRKKYPNAQIDYVIKKQFRFLIEGNPYINKIWVVDSGLGFIGLKELTQEIRKEEYDVFLDIHKNFRSLYVSSNSSPKRTFRYKKNILKRSLLVKFKIDRYKNVEPVFQRYIDTAKKIGVEYDGLGSELYVPEKTQELVVFLYTKHNISLQNKIYILCPGASYSNKQWLPERFSELGQKLLADDPDCSVIFHGGQKEFDICEEMQKSCGERSYNFAGKLNLMESAALINRATTVVANDSGMLHMSESQKVPVVGLYGPTAYQFGFYPIMKESKAIAIDLPCRPCTKMGMNHCPQKHFKCMKDITVEMVFNAVNEIAADRY